MNKPALIIGHGLAGCVLAMICLKRNIPFHLVGNSIQGEASMASSGLIAPVTGRRYVKTWRIDDFIPFALDFYRWSEDILGNLFFRPIEIVRFLSNEEALKAWAKRSADPEYAAYISDKRYAVLDKRERSYGIMTGGYQLDTPGWLRTVHAYLNERQMFDFGKGTDDAIDRDRYHVIWATGATDGRGGHGIIPNKGEALIVRMPAWEFPWVVKEEIFIVPIQDDKYWIGSYYERYPENPLPTAQGKTALLEKLRNLYAGPLEVIDHVAGVRPTVDDRRPIIGLHPGIPGDYLFNGMGTKGTSLAPFWADQLMSHIAEGLPLPPEVRPDRYLV